MLATIYRYPFALIVFFFCSFNILAQEQVLERLVVTAEEGEEGEEGEKKEYILGIYNKADVSEIQASETSDSASPTFCHIASPDTATQLVHTSITFSHVKSTEENKAKYRDKQALNASFLSAGETHVYIEKQEKKPEEGIHIPFLMTHVVDLPAPLTQLAETEFKNLPLEGSAEEGEGEADTRYLALVSTAQQVHIVPVIHNEEVGNTFVFPPHSLPLEQDSQKPSAFTSFFTHQDNTAILVLEDRKVSSAEALWLGVPAKGENTKNPPPQPAIDDPLKEKTLELAENAFSVTSIQRVRENIHTYTTDTGRQPAAIFHNFSAVAGSDFPIRWSYIYLKEVTPAAGTEGHKEVICIDEQTDSNWLNTLSTSFSQTFTFGPLSSENDSSPQYVAGFAESKWCRCLGYKNPQWAVTRSETFVKKTKTD